MSVKIRNEAIRKALRYSYEPIRYNYDELTREERALLSEEEFEVLAKFAQEEQDE